MTIEHRQIEFSAREVLRAVILLHAARPLALSVSVTQIRLSSVNGEVGAIAVLTPKSGGAQREVVLPPATLAAALIRFCRAEQIPLPRRAQKRLVKTGESVALHLDLNAATTQLLDELDTDMVPTLDALSVENS